MPEISSVFIVTHIALGIIAVTAGTLALAALKGAALHIRAGQIFAASMGVSSLIGAILGLIKPETLYITFHAGILGCTLIASAWLTARSGLHPLGWATAIVGGINVINTLGLIALGLMAQSLPDSTLYGFQASDYFFLSCMAGLAAIGDIILLFRRAISERYRIARHLWRMCLAFFIAAGSAFTGPGASVFPEIISRSGVLAVPELLIIALMLFWLLRTLFWAPSARGENTV